MVPPGSESCGTNHGTASKFSLDRDVNASIYLWRGTPWNLEVAAVVNSSNEVCSISSGFSVKLERLTVAFASFTVGLPRPFQ